MAKTRSFTATLLLHACGISPYRPPRLQKQAAFLLGPALLYLVFVILAVGFIIGSSSAPRGAEAIDAALVPFGCLVALFAVPMFVSQETGARRLRRNWPDYRLAGLSGSQMLWLEFGPLIVGLGIGAGLQAVFGAAWGLWTLIFPPYREEPYYEWLIPGLGFVVFMQASAAPLYAALSTLGRRPTLQAALSFALLGLSPAIWYQIANIAVIQAFAAGRGLWPSPAWLPFAALEIASWPLRGWLVRRLWLRAALRLESADVDSRIA